MRSGYLAKNNDIEDFKYGVKWCLDSHNYDTIFSSSRDIVKNKFNEDFIAKEYINFMKRLSTVKMNKSMLPIKTIK